MANEVQVFEMQAGRASAVNFLAKQTLTIGGAISAAFNKSTQSVRIVSTTGCVIEFGAAPDGLGNFYPIVAGQVYEFGVIAGQKVIAVAGTATAPAVTTTGSTADNALIGAVTETAPASDTASSGLNGRLQRIAQRLTSLIALLPASLGGKAASASLSVTQAGLKYETVAASQTAQALGATGATGDFLSHVILQPVTTAAGTCTILDNATVIYTFTTGTLADLRPIIVPVNAFSVSGAWKITTGANVTATGFGDFT